MCCGGFVVVRLCRSRVDDHLGLVVAEDCRGFRFVSASVPLHGRSLLDVVNGSASADQSRRAVHRAQTSVHKNENIVDLR